MTSGGQGVSYYRIYGRGAIKGAGMNCVSCDICVDHLRFVCVFPWGIPQLQSDWSLSCDHGLDYAR